MGYPFVGQATSGDCEERISFTMKQLFSALGWILVATPFLLGWFFTYLRRSAKKQKPRQEGASMVFFVAPGMRILLGSVMLALVLFMILVLSALRFEGESFLALLIPLSVFAALLLARPREVTLDHNGIRQQGCFGQPRVIHWEDVASVIRGRNTGITYVRSRIDRRSISFSPLLVGQAQFVREIRSHAHHFEEWDTD